MSLWPSQVRAGLHGNRFYIRSSHCQAAGLHSSRRHTQRQDPKLDGRACASCASVRCTRVHELAIGRCSGEDEVHISSTCDGVSRRSVCVLASLGCLAGAITPVTAQAAIPEVLPPQSAGLAEKLGRALPFPFPMVTPEPVRFPR